MSNPESFDEEETWNHIKEVEQVESIEKELEAKSLDKKEE